VTPPIDGAAVTALLDSFFGRPDAVGAVNWRGAFDGEVLVLAVAAGTEQLIRVDFADGVAQVAPPAPFDAPACAQVTTTALAAAKEDK
jgi:hypothetical protein